MLVIGHRGDRQRHDDNTIEGIASAFERGADGIEFDVYYLPQKGAYLTHQYLHDRNKKYPMLEDVLKKFSNAGRLQIELKSPTVEAAKAVTKLIEKYKPKDFEITSSVFPLLRYIRELLPKAKIGLIANPLVEEWWTKSFGNEFLLDYLKLTKANGIHIGSFENFWNKKRVTVFHKAGYSVNAHLFTDNKKEYKKLASYGIDSSTADKLDILGSVRS